MGLPTDKIISCFYDSAGDCVKVIDTGGTLMSFNQKGLELMEIDDPKQVIGKKWLDFWKGEMHEEATAAFNKALNGELGYFEGYCPTFKGTPKWWQINIVPLKNEYSEVQWVLSISRDITELRNLKEENEKLKAELSQVKIAV